MKDAQLRPSLAAAGRILQRTRWKPRSYVQAWLFAPVGPVPIGWAIGLLTLEVYKGWPSPVGFPWIAYPVLMVVQGLVWTYDVYQRGNP